MGYKYNEQILRMIKNGYSKEQIESYQKDNKKEYTPDFVEFIKEMLKKYKIKRNDISEITGISVDYLYKILKGTKVTNERDYLIAIAVAVGMNLNETQHLLSISNMHAIDRNDLRDLIIWDSLEDHISLFHVNDRLEKASLPYIKTSKDMETYVPNYNSIYNEKINTFENDKPKKTLTELNREIVSEHVGLAPFDYDYCGTIEVTDEDNNKYYVQGYYSHSGDKSFSVIDEKNHDLFLKSKENPDLINQMEWIGDYAKFEDTYDSEFFHFFLEIDRATTQKVQEMLETLDDTKNYKFRVGANMHGNEWCKYCELFNDSNPAKKQYVQIVETGNKITFSASHESVYMRLELGKLYEIYYGQYEEPLYYIKSDSITNIPELDLVTKCAFQCALVQMHEVLKAEWEGFVTKSEVELLKEKAELFASNATLAFHMQKYIESIEANAEALNYMEELQEKHGVDQTNEVVLTIWKMKRCFESIGDFETAKIHANFILSNKDEILMNSTILNEHASDCVADLILTQAHIEQDNNNYDKALLLSKEAISLLEGKVKCAKTAKTLFTAYNKAAFIFDEKDAIEESEDFYQKAYYLVKKYKLERIDDYKNSVLTFYNNYAWMLWNKIGSEEAIIYYGREIELIEDYLASDASDHESLINMLDHCSEALLKIYVSTGKEFEAKRFEKRIKNIKKL